MTILEALVWNPDVPKPPGTAPRERERAPSIRSSSSTWSLFNGAEDEIDPSELAAIRAFEKLRKLKTPQQKLLEQCKKKAEKDHLSGILSSTGKLQTKALNKQRRVRKVSSGCPQPATLETLYSCEPTCNTSLTRAFYVTRLRRAGFSRYERHVRHPRCVVRQALRSHLFRLFRR